MTFPQHVINTQMSNAAPYSKVFALHIFSCELVTTVNDLLTTSFTNILFSHQSQTRGAVW